MKKIIAAVVLAGCTFFGADANAGDFTLGLPGFFLKVTDGFRKEIVAVRPDRHGVRRHKPAPVQRKAVIRHENRTDKGRKPPVPPRKPHGRR